jgi:hypothetical protein
MNSPVYNLNNRQAGCALNLPSPRAARLFCCLGRQSWSSGPGLCTSRVNFPC